MMISFSDLNAICALLERFTGLTKRKEEDSVAARFICLFESHGVHRNQIPRIFDHGLTVANFFNDNEKQLHDKLSEDVLDDACKLFAVRREWLDGASKQIYEPHHFYKNLTEVIEFTDKLKLKIQDSNIHVILLTPAEKGYSLPALLLFEEELGRIGDKFYYRYYLSEEWTYSYWRCRGFLACYVAICISKGLRVSGVSTSAKMIKSFSSGEIVLGWNGKGTFGIKGTKWYPENLILYPKDFLDGLSSERDNFGIISSLRMWLELESQGLMKIGWNTTEEKNARQLFEQELKKYISL